MAELGLLVKWNRTNFGLLFWDKNKDHPPGRYLIFGLDEYWQPDLSAWHISVHDLIEVGKVIGKDPEPEPEEDETDDEPAVIKFKR